MLSNGEWSGSGLIGRRAERAIIASHKTRRVARLAQILHFAKKRSFRMTQRPPEKRLRSG